MANRILAGAIAGAAGVVALNAAGYLDMLVRGRAASDMPARVAGKLAEELGLPLDFNSDLDADADGEDDADHEDVSDAAAADADLAPDAPANRREAVGALLGMANGIGIGVAYGIVRLILPRPPAWLAGAALGACLL
jgi:hypothetical protein